MCDKVSNFRCKRLNYLDCKQLWLCIMYLENATVIGRIEFGLQWLKLIVTMLYYVYVDAESLD